MINLLEKIIQSPQLPQFAKQIEKILAAEKKLRQEFHSSMKENEKVEFINGKIVYQSPILKKHGSASDNLMVLIKTYTDILDLGYTGHEKYLVTLTRNDYEPDICFWGNKKADSFNEDQMHFPAPDFVVEVLSKSTEKRDRGVKFEDYALHGVAEYWIVSPKFRTVEQYFLDNQTFNLHAKLRNDDLVKSKVIQGFEIPVMAIFDKKENLKALKELIKKIEQ